MIINSGMNIVLSVVYFLVPSSLLLLVSRSFSYSETTRIRFSRSKIYVKIKDKERVL